MMRRSVAMKSSRLKARERFWKPVVRVRVRGRGRVRV